jgi:hypothetical protein
MLYLIGGAARAGKSAIARRFLDETGVTYFGLDYVMMGQAVGAPDSGVDPEDDELHIAELLWPIIRAMATAMLENEEDYLLEGVQLTPAHVRELCDAWPDDVRACFVGYADVETQAKMAQLRRYCGGPDDWLRDYDDAALAREVERIKAQSAFLRSECARLGIAYFEAGLAREETVGAVVVYLRSAQGHSDG